MVFDIEQKVALVTGGASGLGLHYAIELLRNGLKVNCNQYFRLMDHKFGKG